jgi:peptidoglycan lytic transglycosylase G
VSDGPPPVPGGRSPEEREAARREREARRAGRGGAPPPEPPPPERDWLAEAEALTRAPAPDTESFPRAPADGGPPRFGGPAGFGGPARARRPRGRRLVALAAVAVVLVGLAWFLILLFQPFKGDGEGEVRVTIPQGASLGEIADLLESKDVVSSSSFFQLRARLAGRSGSLKPGNYTLARDMSFMGALDRLEEGLPPNVVQIGIPEGLSRTEVAPLVKRLKGNYVKATRHNRNLDPREYKAKGAKSLEGFLFPATYELKKGQHVRKLVDQQLAAFKRNFETVDLRYARSKNLTPYDVLIIASLIEREVQVPKERSIVASVIYNRLKAGLRLDIDATVRFVVGKWSGALRVSELQNPSPYNTRVHPGLPPGPIGSPGLASIKAAARPAKTNYLFYVAAVCGNGSHKFASTDAQFQRYVDAYNRARDERGGKSPTEC